MDPCEKLIRDALRVAGIEFVDEAQNPSHLDFNLTGLGIQIEVKQFHSPRISDQMARAPNVIAVQGHVAAVWLARLIGTAKNAAAKASAINTTSGVT